MSPNPIPVPDSPPAPGLRSYRTAKARRRSARIAFLAIAAGVLFLLLPLPTAARTSGDADVGFLHAVPPGTDALFLPAGSGRRDGGGVRPVIPPGLGGAARADGDTSDSAAAGTDPGGLRPGAGPG